MERGEDIMKHNDFFREEQATARFFDRVSSEVFWVSFEGVELTVLDWIMENLQLRGDDFVLEPGCGAGRFSKIMAPKVSISGRIISFDISRKMIRRMAQWGMPKEVLYLCATASRLPFPSAIFDKIICINVFPHLDDKKEVMKEFFRVLRYGGHLFIAHTKGRAELNNFHAGLDAPINSHILPDRESMEVLMKHAGFDVVLLIDESDKYLLKAVKG